MFWREQLYNIRHSQGCSKPKTKKKETKKTHNPPSAKHLAL